MNKEIASFILAQNQRSYNIIGKEFSQTRKKRWKDLDFIFDHIHDGDLVLDVGCGNGRMALELGKRKNVEYVGVDNSEELINEAQSSKFKVQNEGKKLETGNWKLETGNRFFTGDALGLDQIFSKDHFDVVLCIAVLHHFPTRELRWRVLRNIFQVLKPNGVLLMTNWNLWRLAVREKSVWKCALEKWRYSAKAWGERFSVPKDSLCLRDCFTEWRGGGSGRGLYYYAFTREELRRGLAEAGFSIEKNNYVCEGRRSTIFFGRNIATVARKC